MAKTTAAAATATATPEATEAPSITTLITRAVAVARAYVKDKVPTSPPGGEKDFWQKQGPHIEAAIEVFYNTLKANVTNELACLGLTWPMVNRTLVAKIIVDAVKAWDDEFKWDAPNMTEGAEDTFYEFLAKRKVSNLFTADGF